MRRLRLTTEQIARVRSLEDPRGGLTPARLVEDARDAASPCHALFTWNDADAAARYRLDEARLIIGAIYQHLTTQTTIVTAPHYVRDPSALGQGYRSVVALRSEPEQAREAVVAQLETAAGHLRRALALAESLGLAPEIDQLLERITGVQRALARAA